ncbi:MAG: hypothetical protein ABIF10_05915 [Candidatus Woesearchaeota archaeon]
MSAKFEMLKKKYKLPSYEELDREFDLGKLDDDISLRWLRKRVFEFLDMQVALVEEVLHPDSRMSSLYECMVLGDEKKAQLFSLYKKLMKLLRHAQLASLESDEKEAKFLLDALKEWPPIRKAMVAIVAELMESWQKEQPEQEDVRYLG